MNTSDADIRRALNRLRRALEKARREIRRLRESLEPSEADGFPGDDYAEMDAHLVTTVELVSREQARQQAKILRAGGIAPGRLQGRSDSRFGASAEIGSDGE